MNYYEKTLKTETVYHGSIIDVQRLTVELPNGREATRDIVRNIGASVVVPINDKGQLILVEQFRKPNEKVFIELPAGKLDYKDEDPLECAVRELKEETGYTAENIKKILSIHPAPAFADEVLHIYLATGLTQGECDPDEDEFITAKPYDFNEVLTMIEEGTITDAKTVAGILMAARLLNL
ncbi:MAG: NUDIX hydrolase [Clostridia bacterium]|nr:NUDIX hydrolase [Clostridia bacterium]